jgi:hypothetical protein
VVGAVGGDSDCFPVGVGLCRASVLGRLLLVMVVYAVTGGLREGLPWGLLGAGVLVLVASGRGIWGDAGIEVGVWSRGLVMSVVWTRVMLGGEGLGLVEVTCRCLCGIYGGGCVRWCTVVCRL